MKNVLLIIALVAGLIAISFFATCGVIYLICLCFGLEFQWGIAAGIWLVLTLLSGFFKGGSSHAN